MMMNKVFLSLLIVALIPIALSGKLLLITVEDSVSS